MTVLPPAASLQMMTPAPGLHSAQEIYDLMPEEVRSQVLGAILVAGLEPGKPLTRLFAEALVRTLEFANEERETAPAHALWERFRRFDRIGDWIRNTMDLAQEEGVFTEILKPYERALALQSSEAVRDVLAELPSSVVLRLSERVPELMEEMPRLPSPVGEFRAAGQFLGQGLWKLYLGAILFGAEKGLFRPGDFGVTEGHLQDYWGKGMSPNEVFVLVDSGYLENLHRFEAVRDNVQRDWGRLHPLVSGIAQVFSREGFSEEQGVQGLRRASEEVEAFLTRPRH
jgi:hypothetical protein